MRCAVVHVVTIVTWGPRKSKRASFLGDSSLDATFSVCFVYLKIVVLSKLAFKCDTIKRVRQLNDNGGEFCCRV